MHQTTIAAKPAEPVLAERKDTQLLDARDVRHNIRVNVFLDAIFAVGAADLAIASGPLYVFLGASNSMIGLMQALGWTALFGVMVSPFISRRFPRKKWYLFISHLPYIGAWGLMGLAIVFSDRLGLDHRQLLLVLLVMNAANLFFSGFVTLPHTEFLAACIPMSHRGRYSGFSMSLGAAGSIISSAIGGLILLHGEKPMAFGYLYLMMWFFAQAGYLLALLAREPRTPVEASPPPWSRHMFAALWRDKPFLRVLLLNLLFYNLMNPAMTFVPIYGYKVLGMSAATAATIAIIQQVARMTLSAPVGVWTDRWSAKRLLPLWFLAAAASFVPVLLARHPWAVYVSAGLTSLCITGITAAFNPLIFGTPTPENRAGHFSTQTLLRNLLDSVGMIGVGVLFDLLGFKMMFALWVALGTCLAMTAAILMRPLSARAEDYA